MNDLALKIGAIAVAFFVIALFIDERADIKETTALIELGVAPVYAICVVEGCSQIQWEAAKRIVKGE